MAKLSYIVNVLPVLSKLMANRGAKLEVLPVYPKKHCFCFPTCIRLQTKDQAVTFIFNLIYALSFFNLYT